MKKIKRTILFLESLENRVVPSNTHALLDADHSSAGESAMVAEMETPRMETEVRETEASEVAKEATVSDDMTSSEKSNPSHTQTETHTDVDQGAQHEATITTSPESAEAHTADLTNADFGKKALLDSGNAKAKDSSSDPGNSSLANSSGSSIADPDPVRASKNHANNSFTKDTDDLKSTPSSSDSQTGSGVTGSTGDQNSSGSAKSKDVDTGTRLVTDTNHGKSNSEHKDLSSTSSTNSSDGIQSVSAPHSIAREPKLSDLRLSTTTTESNQTASESVRAPSVGFTLEGEGGQAAFSSVAAMITAKEAGLNLPQVAEAAIPLAVPVLESLTQEVGLGDLGDWSALAAAEGLAPVAGDLIVGFLPVEQMALAPAMQGVLSQIDNLGEQLVGSSAAKWLYPFIFTALAATTLYLLTSRRRRQFRGQSIWARDNGSWSSTWFPFLASSIQE
jgi:hypothetical protein